MSATDRYPHAVYGNKLTTAASDDRDGDWHMLTNTAEAVCTHDEALAKAEKLRADGWSVQTVGCGCPVPEAEPAAYVKFALDNTTLNDVQLWLDEGRAKYGNARLLDVWVSREDFDEVVMVKLRPGAPVADTDRTAAIRARLDAATPGRWDVCQSSSVDGDDVLALREPYEFTVNDAELVANAPADLAWLLAELDAMRADRDNLNRQLNDIYAARFLESD